MASLHVHIVEYFKISTGELPSEPGILGFLHLDLVRPSPTLIVENWLCKVVCARPALEARYHRSPPIKVGDVPGPGLLLLLSQPGALSHQVYG